ncbi:MAG: hypothetical protein KDA75_00435 [Planctomycetaceae bacterium]|nr:hypothetical protein [Planctomycetaceae bacterium]
MPHAVRRSVCLPGVIAVGVLLVGLAGESPAQSRRSLAARPVPLAEGIQVFSSPNFRVVTDLTDKEGQELLERLETMLKLVSGYFGKRNIRSIDMYVARDITQWPAAVLGQMDPDGIASIRGGAGVTQATTALINGRPVDAKAVVYAVADHGTPQHEAVHAYCSLAFGSTGPVWYSEGMAEVGQYWRDGEKGVNAHPEVIRYLQESTPKPLNDIVNNPLETTGDSWQNYAWRWALCHMLGHNTNYTDRFKPLGMALLHRKEIDFWQVYGAQATEIAFEYEFFLRHVEAGYRVDLCSWDWKAKPRTPLRSGSSIKISANRGWQASKLQLTAGESYTFETTGDWTIEQNGDPLSAAGNGDGGGMLVGCVFDNYTLSDEFELGETGSFTAPADGHLVLRCRDGWGMLADNKGSVTLKLRPAMP